MPKKESGMWRNKNAPMSKNYRRGGSTYMGGGMTPEEQSSIYRGGPSQPTTGMKKGGTFGNFKVPTLDGKPRRITRKTPQESKVRKKPGMFGGGMSALFPTGKNMTKSERLKYQKDGIPLQTLGKPYEGKVRKKPGMAAGGKLQQQQENQKKAHQGPKLKTIGSKSTKAKATKVKFPKGVLLNSPEGRALSKKKPQERKVRKKPGMGSGGMTINKRTLAKMTPKQLKSKTMTDYFGSKVSESRKGRKKGPGMAGGGRAGFWKLYDKLSSAWPASTGTKVTVLRNSSSF